MNTKNIYRKLLYYYSYHGSDLLPSLQRILFNRVLISFHVPKLWIWSMELSFLHGQLSLSYFVIPRWFAYNSDKTKIGSLQSISFRLGRPIIDICLTKRKFNRHIEALERDNLPADFYKLVRTKQQGKRFYDLYFNYSIYGKRRVQQLKEPEFITGYAKKPSKAEIYRQIMLNDWSRWNTELNDTDKIEVSENIYDEMLSVLPPRNWQRSYFEVGEPHHHDGNGKPVHRALNQVNGKYYTGHPKVIYFMKPAN